MNIINHITNNRLHVIVKPNSPKTKIIRWDEIRKSLRIEIAAAPDNGKANKELIKFLTKILKEEMKKNISKRVNNVEIISGKTSRKKVIMIVE